MEMNKEVSGFNVMYPSGLKYKGNLSPLKAIAIVKNKDGSTSTVRTMSVNFGEGEVLIPTVHPDGYVMSNDEAIDRYQKTGENFGTFETVEDANRYAQALHESQSEIGKKKKGE